MDKENSYSKLWLEIKKYLKFNIDYAKLTVAEKLTVLCSAAVVALGITFLSLIFIFFISLAAVNWLASAIGFALSYIIISGFYLILAAVIFFFRKELIMNPIAKFISKLFFK